MLQEDFLKNYLLKKNNTLVYAFFFALIIYIYPLFNFSLVIDSERFSLDPKIYLEFIQHGRWGLALITYILPEYVDALPFISNLFFLAGLIISSQLFSALFTRNKYEALPFVFVYISSPIWLHIVEFSSFSHAVGFALVGIAYAATLIQRAKPFDTLTSGLLIAFCISIYQSLILIYALTCLFLIFRDCIFLPESFTSLTWKERVSVACRAFISTLIAVIVYLAIQVITLKLFHLKITYINDYIANSLEWRYLFNSILLYLVGSHEIFLGKGLFILLLPWLGMVSSFIRIIKLPDHRFTHLLMALIVLTLAIFIASIPILISANTIPARGQSTFVVLYALMSVNAFIFIRKKILWQYLICAYILIVCLWVAISVFYSDYIVKQRDLMVATRISEHIETLGREKFHDKIPLLIVGLLDTYPYEGVERHVEEFGTSFFSLTDTPSRVINYLHLLGISGIKRAPLQAMETSAEKIAAMPNWPSAGSIALVDNNIVVKFSNLPLIKFYKMAAFDQRLFQNTGLQCYIDIVSKEMKMNHVTNIIGWISGQNQPLNKFKLVLIGNDQFFAIDGEINHRRPDVAKVFNNPNLAYSGFQIKTVTAAIPSGKYKMALVANLNGQDRICPTNKTLAI